ncbi:MAG: L-2-amino-thiazoline-4-carboxylic acid hydrolase [Anaerolineales bacterium]|jgi:hypothetical protein
MPATDLPNDYYTSQHDRLIGDFDRRSGLISKVLNLHEGVRPTEDILHATRHTFERLIPEIPYIGGKANRLTEDLIGCAMMLSLYRVLKSNGWRVEKIGQIVIEMERLRVYAYPGMVRKLLGRAIHSRWGIRRLRQAAEASQQRRYPGGWVSAFVEGDGEQFDFGIDYLECGLCKFFHQQGADEFTPYLCLIDFVQQRAMGTGFMRTMTLAEGATKCDFRWKRGVDTRPAWPPHWLETSNRT